jgi:hypothetical protein
MPDLGMFGAVDRYAPGEMTYGYAGGNPIMFKDPSGNGAVVVETMAGMVAILTALAAINTAHFVALAGISTFDSDVESCDYSWSLDRLFGIPINIRFHLNTKMKDGRQLYTDIGLFDLYLLASAAGKAGNALRSFLGKTKEVKSLESAFRSAKTLEGEAALNKANIIAETNNGPVSLNTARLAAERNGIDMKMFELRYEPTPSYIPNADGFHSVNGAGKILRAPNGKFILTLTDNGLASSQNAVKTIAHELNHIRGILHKGEVTTEVIAEGAAASAGNYFKK